MEIPVVFNPAKPDYIDIIDARVEGDLADRWGFNSFDGENLVLDCYDDTQGTGTLIATVQNSQTGETSEISCLLCNANDLTKFELEKSSLYMKTDETF